MKKILSIAALTLVIVTTLLAGTMAIYTKTLEPLEGEVTAKQFYIGNTETSFADVRLAPSEKTEWEFSVVNYQGEIVTEVDMDLNILIDVDGDIDGLNVSLYEGTTKIGDTIVKDGSINYEIEKAFLKNAGNKRDFKVVVEWVNGQVSDATDTANADMGATANISVTVTGTQNIGA